MIEKFLELLYNDNIGIVYNKKNKKRGVYMNLEQEVFEISLQDIMPNRFQPREIFDEEALDELSKSIKEHGVIQPIIVRKIGDKYEIIAGERRFRASQLAGKTTIPALVRNIDDKEAAKIALLENLQRKDLTPIEEAKTYQTILKLDNLTQEELAASLGKSQSAIANKIRLLNLDEEVQTALLNQKISERHARSLLNVENKELQKELLEKIIRNRLTVRQLDEEIQRLTGKVIDSEDEETINNTKEEVQTILNQAINQPITPINQEEKKIETPIEESPANIQPEINTELEEIKPKINYDIFNNLRINEKSIEELDDKNKTVENNISDENDQYNNIYDLRFAINNVRQAVQNTEKFGFSITTEEFDYENTYQIIIKIDKNK